MSKTMQIKVLILLFLIMSTYISHAQGTTVECGSIIEAEFTPGNTTHNYIISLVPGDVLTIRTEAVGDLLNVNIGVRDPQNHSVGSSLNYGPTENLTTPVLSARGNYTIQPFSLNNHAGIYTLYIGCTLRDGTVIEPGDIPSSAQSTTTQTNASVVPTFSGVGFPGLAPVDFATVARIPLTAGTPMTAAITPTGGEILGYTLELAAGDVIDLSFTRLSGNLNLGLVVLSANNEVAFQASLVTSQTLTTRFTLPSAGQYTIGVFRIDLLPPASPEATAFQIQATLNP